MWLEGHLAGSRMIRPILMENDRGFPSAVLEVSLGVQRRG